MECTLMVQVGPRIITNVTRIADWSQGQNLSDFRERDLFTIPAVCKLVGIARQTVYNTLSVHRDWFTYPKLVRTGYRGIEERLLTLSDVTKLAERYPVRVKY